MADFFTSLVDRSLGTAPMLQPVLTPLFGATESTRPNEFHSHADFEESNEEIAALPVHPMAAPAAQATPSTENIPPFVPPTLRGNAPEHETAAQEIHAPQIFTSPPLVYSPHTAAPASDGIVHEQAYSKPVLDLRRDASDGRVAQSRVPLPVKDKPASASQQISEQRPDTFDRVIPLKMETGREQQRPAFASRPLLPREDFSQTEVLSTPQPDLAGTIRPAVAAESKLIFEKRVHHDMASATASASAPTIRVNIGRIEVRAVHPQSSSVAPKQRKRSGPLLSLEDYLRQRNGR